MARILVVDDEPDILLLMRINLEGEGHDVFLAADGEMALQRIAEHQPELVLCDVMMPVLDGWGVLSAPETPASSVIMVSAKADPRDARRALELGAIDYFVKPFDLDQLLDAVQEHLGRTPDERHEHRVAALDAMGTD